MAIFPERSGQSKPWYNLILHIHPRKVNSYTLRFNLTFGLGGIATLLVVIQVFTGLLLKFHYIPSPAEAYNSVLNINEGLLFGKLAHNIHHWSAVSLLWITFLHMLRVIFTGAYRKPGQATWIFGNFLLLLVVLSNFTGYLLPWDQLSYWAVTICTSMLKYIPVIGTSLRETLLGGQEVGSPALSNFFNLHTGIIPLLLIILMVYHFWCIRKAGGVIVPQNFKNSEMADTQPDLVTREFVAALVLLAFILIISVFFDAPMRERADPSFSPNPAKAPWYFMGLQELLIHFHPFIAVVVFPLALIFLSFRLPYIKLNDNNQGRWFLSEKGKLTTRYSLVSGFVFTILFILIREVLPDPETLLPAVPSLISTGIVPLIIVTGSLFLFMKYLKLKFSINSSEYIQAIVVILVISYTVLSLTGIFFRGAGMKLMWPWGI